MTLEEYQKLIDEHDWLYQYTDDHRVWKREEQKRQLIRHIATQLKGKFLELYNETKAKYGS